jgi:hypothetical protein
MESTAGVPVKGQVVRIRPIGGRGRAKFIRIIEVTERTGSDGGCWVTVHGYRTRRDGLPVLVNPVTVHRPLSDIEIVSGEAKGRPGQ